MRELGAFIAGESRQSGSTITVRSPYDGREVARVARGAARAEPAVLVVHEHVALARAHR